MNDKNIIELTILKIVNRINKAGINMKNVFMSWDKDNSGHCK